MSICKSFFLSVQDDAHQAKLRLHQETGVVKASSRATLVGLATRRCTMKALNIRLEFSNPMHEQKGITQHILTYPKISSRGQVGITQDKGGYPYLSRCPGLGYPSITWDKFEDPI